jgi:hypothetical protein
VNAWEINIRTRSATHLKILNASGIFKLSEVNLALPKISFTSLSVVTDHPGRASGFETLVLLCEVYQPLDNAWTIIVTTRIVKIVVNVNFPLYLTKFSIPQPRVVRTRCLPWYRITLRGEQFRGLKFIRVMRETLRGSHDG